MKKHIFKLYVLAISLTLLLLSCELAMASSEDENSTRVLPRLLINLEDRDCYCHRDCFRNCNQTATCCEQTLCYYGSRSYNLFAPDQILAFSTNGRCAFAGPAYKVPGSVTRSIAHFDGYDVAYTGAEYQGILNHLFCFY